MCIRIANLHISQVGCAYNVTTFLYNWSNLHDLTHSLGSRVEILNLAQNDSNISPSNYVEDC